MPRTIGRQGMDKVLSVAFEEVLDFAGSDTIYFPEQFVRYLKESVFAHFDPTQPATEANRKHSRPRSSPRRCLHGGQGAPNRPRSGPDQSIRRSSDATGEATQISVTTSTLSARSFVDELGSARPERTADSGICRWLNEWRKLGALLTGSIGSRLPPSSKLRPKPIRFDDPSRCRRRGFASSR